MGISRVGLAIKGFGHSGVFVMREFQKEVYDLLYQFCLEHEVNPLIIDLYDIRFMPEIHKFVSGRHDTKDSRQYFPVGMTMKDFLEAVNRELSDNVQGDFDESIGKVPGTQLTLGNPDFSSN